VFSLFRDAGGERPDRRQPEVHPIGPRILLRR
jgi:hypothetical protein